MRCEPSHGLRAAVFDVLLDEPRFSPLGLRGFSAAVEEVALRMMVFGRNVLYERLGRRFGRIDSWPEVCTWLIPIRVRNGTQPEHDHLPEWTSAGFGCVVDVEIHELEPADIAHALSFAMTEEHMELPPIVCVLSNGLVPSSPSLVAPLDLAGIVEESVCVPPIEAQQLMLPKREKRWRSLSPLTPSPPWAHLTACRPSIRRTVR
jgi:hypothetical protein